MSQNPNYRIYKHCLTWARESFEETKLSKTLIHNLLRNKKRGGWMLRNCYDWDCEEPTNFWEIIQDRHYDIAELPTKVRNQIRRCFKDCEIKRITNIELVRDNGYLVYSEAFKRYHDIAVFIDTREQWEKSILAQSGLEYWGVYSKVTGQMIAWALNKVKKHSVNYMTLKAIPELMNRHYPYYGLLYEMGRYYLAEKGYSYVSDGWRNISGHSNIQPFLEQKFLFRKAYCKMDLHYATWLKCIIYILYPFRKLPIIPLPVRNLLKFEGINRGK